MSLSPRRNSAIVVFVVGLLLSSFALRTGSANHVDDEDEGDPNWNFDRYGDLEIANFRPNSSVIQHLFVCS